MKTPTTVAEWNAMSPEEQDALIASGWHPGPGAYSDRALQVSYAQRDRDYWKQRGKELQDELDAERRDRKWWAANNSRERRRLEEQLEQYEGALRLIGNGGYGDASVKAKAALRA